jgi:hypothetical protein
MPTNPLWIEHTERAAWDTVQTLRQQIETERARVEQLVRIQRAWPKMLEAVASARALHGITESDDVTTVEQLSSELARLKREHAELLEKLHQGELKLERDRIVAASRLDTSARRSERRAHSVDAFMQLVKQHAAESVSKPSRSYERLLDVLDAKLEELEHAPRRERCVHAVELAYLAWRVALSSPVAPTELEPSGRHTPALPDGSDADAPADGRDER